MLSLLALPREVRDLILIHVLSLSPSAPSTTRRHRTEDSQGRFRRTNVFVPISKDAYYPQAISLLQTSRQLHAETIECLKWASHSLDIAFIDMLWLWPTWRSILPKVSDMAHQLDVNVFFASSETIGVQTARDARHLTHMLLWDVIHRFLLFGPVYELPEKTFNLCLKRLNITVVVPDHIPANHTFSDEDIPYRNIEGMAHLQDTHDRLCYTEQPWTTDLARTWINHCAISLHEEMQFARRVERGSNFRLPYKEIFLERIGSVTFYLNDEIIKELNLADYVSATYAGRVPLNEIGYRAVKRELRERNGI